VTATIEFRSPEGGFDEPLALWLACHQRVLRFCTLLERLRVHVEHNGADEEAATSARSIRRYFNEAAPRHHADEEVDLFPRLLRRLAEKPAALSPDDDSRTRSAIEALTAEHRANEVLWSALDAALEQIERGVVARLDSAPVAAFGQTYRGHIEVEEGVVMPAMKRVFDTSDWADVGRAMAARRGVTA
jgi:pyridoxamine 5'-phosphate oxidase